MRNLDELAEEFAFAFISAPWHPDMGCDWRRPPDVVATEAYAYANALIAERESLSRRATAPSVEKVANCPRCGSDDKDHHYTSAPSNPLFKRACHYLKDSDPWHDDYGVAAGLEARPTQDDRRVELIECERCGVKWDGIASCAIYCPSCRRTRVIDPTASPPASPAFKVGQRVRAATGIATITGPHAGFKDGWEYRYDDPTGGSAWDHEHNLALIKPAPAAIDEAGDERIAMELLDKAAFDLGVAVETMRSALAARARVVR